MARTITTAFVALIAVSLLTSCERPFVDPPRPELEVVSPDFSTVFPNTKLQLQVRASSDRGVARVEVDGDSLIFDEDAGLWVSDYALHDGLNRLVFSVTDMDGQSAYDTVYAMHGAMVAGRNVPVLPEPRGGHTATRLVDGSVVVIGGAPRSPADAIGSALILRPEAFAFELAAGELNVPRSGHTATLLPDGRILIVGGARREPAEEIGDLVEAAEIYDPATGRFKSVPVGGAPIRRAYHTATLHVEGGGVYIDLYGGLGDIRYSPESTFGTRWDLRRFEFKDDRLTALSPAPGPSLTYALWGHTQTPIDAVGSPERFLVVGSNSGPNGDPNTSFVVDYGGGTGIAQRIAGPLKIPRVRHASALLKDGFVASFGGYNQSSDLTLNEVEIYAVDADRHFIFPQTNLLPRVLGLSATKLEGERILLLGGFVASGQGVTAVTIFQFPNL